MEDKPVKRKRGKPKGLPPPKSAWKKGQSGNPSGAKRIAEVAEFREALKEILPPSDVARMLVELIAHTDPLVSLKAIGMYLDRFYGKPVQAIDATVSTPDAIKVLFRLPDNGR